MKEHSDCPKCGYPGKQQELGLYFPGDRCPNCSYLDSIAYSSLKAAREMKEAETKEYKKQIIEYNSKATKPFKKV